MRVGKRREEKDPHYLTSLRSIQFVFVHKVSRYNCTEAPGYWYDIYHTEITTLFIASSY